MKGPGLRWDLDVRRVWRCAVCETERHTQGNVTQVACHFCQDHPPMSLIDPQRPDRAPAEALDLVIELHPDDVDAPAFVPVHLRDPDDSLAEKSEEAETAAPVEPADADSQPAVEAEVATATKQESPPAATSDGSKKPRRKKNRRKRKPRQGVDESPAPPASSSSASAPEQAPSADDSFGAGLDT